MDYPIGQTIGRSRDKWGPIMTNYSINVKQTIDITPTAAQRLQIVFDKNFKERLRERIQTKLKLAGNDCCAYLADQSARIYWKRRFQQGWRFKVSPMQLTIYNAEQHAIFIEKGRRAGAKPPPAAAIAEWVLDKLGPEVSPYAVARGIGRKGIAPRPVMLSLKSQQQMLMKVENRLFDALQDALAR